jgi:uncharacterized protein DUF4384
MATIKLTANGSPSQVRLTETVVAWPNESLRIARSGIHWNKKARVNVLLALFAQYKLWHVQKINNANIPEFEIRGNRGELAAQLRDCLDNSHPSRERSKFQSYIFGTDPHDPKQCRLEQMLEVRQESGAFVARIKTDNLSAESVEILWNHKRLETESELVSLLEAIGFPFKSNDLSISVDIRIWDEHIIRQNLSTNDPGSLPLLTGDQIKINMKLNRPAHIYVVWITSSGLVQPLYPWEPGKWENCHFSQPLDHLTLPPSTTSQNNDKWGIDGPAGVETLVLMVNEKPLSDTSLVRLPSVFAELPVRTAMADKHTPFSFVCRNTQNVHQERLVFDSEPITNPLDKFHEVLQDRLSSRCSLVQAVSFANQGPERVLVN